MDNYYDLIEKYVLGELTELEKENFEKALLSDKELAKSVEDHLEMSKRLGALRLRKKVISIIENTNTESKPILSGFSWFTIAASILFVIGAIWYLNVNNIKLEKLINTEEKTSLPVDSVSAENNSQPIANATDTNHPIPNKKLPSKNSIPFQFAAMASALLISPSEILLRDMEPIKSSEVNAFQLATEAYAKKDYALSLSLLQKIQLENQNEDFLILRAHNYFQLGIFSQSSKDFEVLHNSFQYKHEARWNFLLCQLALGKLEKVNMLLDNMISDKDFPFRDKAIELKAKLTI